MLDDKALAEAMEAEADSQDEEAEKTPADERAERVYHFGGITLAIFVTSLFSFAFGAVPLYQGGQPPGEAAIAWIALVVGLLGIVTSLRAFYYILHGFDFAD